MTTSGGGRVKLFISKDRRKIPTVTFKMDRQRCLWEQPPGSASAVVPCPSEAHRLVLMSLAAHLVVKLNGGMCEEAGEPGMTKLAGPSSTHTGIHLHFAS